MYIAIYIYIASTSKPNLTEETNASTYYIIAGFKMLQYRSDAT